MEPDYKRMWNDWKKAMGACDHGFIVTEKMLEEFEKRNTHWEPMDGEWVTGGIITVLHQPFMWKKEYSRTYTGAGPFPLCHPVLKCGGFKVGERVRDDAGNEFTIDSFVLQPNEEASVHSGYGITIPIYKLRHLPPPEPDEYVTHCTAGRSVRVQKGKGINVIHIEYVDARIGDCITLRYEEVDEVIEYLQKLKKKLEV